MRKRSTFKAKRPAKAINLHLFARRSIWADQKRRSDRAKALKKPGAKIAASKAIATASDVRSRKAEKREAAYLAGLAGYHPAIKQASV